MLSQNLNHAATKKRIGQWQKTSGIFLLALLAFISFDLMAQEDFDPYIKSADDVTVVIKLENYKGAVLPNEQVQVLEYTTRRSKVFYSNPEGIITFKVTTSAIFEINFKYDAHYMLIDTKQYLSGDVREYDRKMLNIVVTYEGTQEIERKKKEIEDYETLARSKWRESSANSLKNELQEYANGKYKFRDEVFLKVMKRNVKWKDKLIVCDITGSMYPYIGQVLLWYKLNYIGEKTTRLCFFNDGDSLADHLKLIGKTGGIYYCEKCSKDSLMNVMARAMAAGCGGDAPENNIEALLSATQKMKGFKELILVADNNCSVKDIELLDRLKIPVHVIVCGSEERLGADYLQIAYQTKGSIHTIEEDIENIASMKEGSVIKIGDRKYKLRKGSFHVINKN